LQHTKEGKGNHILDKKTGPELTWKSTIQVTVINSVIGIVNKFAVVSVLWTLPSSLPKCFLLCLLYSF